MKWLPRIQLHACCNNLMASLYLHAMPASMDVLCPFTFIVQTNRRAYWFGWARTGSETLCGEPYRFYFGGSPWRRIR